MHNEEIVLYCNNHRLSALRLVVTAQNKDVEGELYKAFEQLYEQNVSAEQREKIERYIADERVQEEAEREAAKRFAVIHFHDADDDYFFTSERRNSFYSIANLYRSTIKDEVGKYTLDSIASCNFSGQEPISERMFSVLCTAMPHDDRIAAVIEFDFDHGNVSVYEGGDTTWRAYHLKDISSAMYKAECKSELALNARYTIFETALEGKEIVSDGFADENETPALQM